MRTGRCCFGAGVLDISVAGCYVDAQARLRLQRGTKVEMVFKVNGVTFCPMATTKMIRPGTGAGFRFSNVNERMQLELEALIGALAAETGDTSPEGKHLG